MDKRHLILIAVGALMILAGFTADVIGIGAEPAIFGWKQKTLIVLGGLVAGYALGNRSAASKEESSEEN